MQEDIKIFSKKKFTTFEHFNKDKFIDHIKSPYPRGRKHNLRSGMKPESVKDINCNDKYCSSWLKYDQYVDINGNPHLRSKKWISMKMYAKMMVKSYMKDLLNKKDKIIVTESGKVQFKDILIKSNAYTSPINKGIIKTIGLIGGNAGLRFRFERLLKIWSSRQNY